VIKDDLEWKWISVDHTNYRT